MNGFKVRSIRRWEKRAEQWVKGHLILTVVALLLGLLTLRGVAGAIKVGEPFSVKQIVIHAITEGIEMDRYGHTNVLIVGVGGEGHDGENLTDTMIVASIDHKNNLVPMLSIPRDIYVENDMVGWGTRINGVYEYIYDETENHELAMSELIHEIELMLDIPIHYYAKIDFQGFVDVVDALGGVEITLDGSFYDPFYPADYPTDEQPFQEFHLPSGTQTLTGEDALKYVRSRKTTSDFDRAARQQEIIQAIKDKALSLGFLANPGKIKNMTEAISNNFETNIDSSSLLTLASMASDFSSDSILTEVLNDAAFQTGGFFYTPEREDYGGAFVLVPYAGDFSEVQLFAQLYFYHPQIFKEQVPLEILNGTKEEGLAGLTKMHLVRYGFNVVAYGNAYEKGVEDSSIYPLTEFSDNETLDLLPAMVMGDVIEEIPAHYNSLDWPTDATVLVELGEDFVDYYNEYSERFYLGFY